MRNSIIIVFLFVIVRCNSQPVNFTISGTFSNNTTSKTLYIFLMDSLDSTKIKSDHSFSYTGKTKTPRLILMNTENSYNTSVWVNGGDVQIVLEEYRRPDINTLDKVLLRVDSVKGVGESMAYQNILETLNNISSRYKTHTPQKVDSVMREFAPAINEYVHKFPGSWLSPLLVRFYEIPLQDKITLLAMMTNNPNKDELKNLQNQVQRSTLLEKGKVIEDFTQTSLNGKPFELYSVKKPFILLQFWSSDCVPCRYENPHLVNLYSKYQSKGLEIVGISLDDDNAEWTRAVTKDSLPWINISDLKGFESKLAHKYSIDFIPFNILLNDSYAVIATNVSSNELAKIIDKRTTPVP